MAKTWQPLRWADVRLGDVVLWPDGEARPVFHRWQMGNDVHVNHRHGDADTRWRVRAHDMVPVLVEGGDDPMTDAMLTFTAAGFTLEPADPAERKQRS